MCHFSAVNMPENVHDDQNRSGREGAATTIPGKARMAWCIECVLAGKIS